MELKRRSRHAFLSRLGVLLPAIVFFFLTPLIAQQDEEPAVFIGDDINPILDGITTKTIPATVPFEFSLRYNDMGMMPDLKLTSVERSGDQLDFFSQRITQTQTCLLAGNPADAFRFTDEDPMSVDCGDIQEDFSEGSINVDIADLEVDALDPGLYEIMLEFESSNTDLETVSFNLNIEESDDLPYFELDNERVEVGEMVSLSAVSGESFARMIAFNHMGMMPDLELASVSRGGVDLTGVERTSTGSCDTTVPNPDFSVIVEECDGGPSNDVDEGELVFNAPLEEGVYDIELKASDNTGAIYTITIQLAVGNVVAIPSMSEWGLFLFMLLVLGLGLVTIYNVQLAAASSSGSAAITAPRFQWPFDLCVFKRMMPHALGLGLVGLVVILIFWGEFLLLDAIGLALAVPMAAYLLHIAAIMRTND